MGFVESRQPRGPAATRRAQGTDGPVYAALDLGTNNCRLLVAVPQNDGFRVIDSFSRAVRLGEGLAANGLLRVDAMNRTLRALNICAGRLRQHGATRVRAIATEACRRAANGEAFRARVEKETGIQIEIISSEEEASLTVGGCTPLLDRHAPHALIFDIGGGSTEVIWIGLSAAGEPALLDVMSIPAGVVTLAERYGYGALDDDDREEVRRMVDSAIAPFCARNGVAEKVAAGAAQMLGTSGTITTLGAMHLGLARYERVRVDGLWLSLDVVRDLSEVLLGMDMPQRAAVPSIGEARADLVAAGCSILDALCRRWPADRIRIADRGIREGILLDLIRTDQAASVPPRVS